MAPSEVWKYFENKAVEGLAVCNICKSSLKNNRISNLKAHLQKQHKIDVNVISLENLETSSTSSCSKIIRKKK